MLDLETARRTFLTSAAALAGASAASAASATTASENSLPAYARAQVHQSLKQSSFDTTGGNKDAWAIAPGATKELFAAKGPGVVTHIWFTISAQSANHLKEVVIRMYWDGASQPSVEVPVGDFFGLNLGQYFTYQSAFLNCSSVKALNCYFAMPFRKQARITATNEGALPVGSFYSNIDYQLTPALPADALYFHAQYRQATPNPEHAYPGSKNLMGEHNYVFAETSGRGHLMGVTLGVLQTADNWMGEGDDMIFVDGASTPTINGTGLEDYFCGAWDFGGRENAQAFAHLYNGAPYIAAAERAGGRYCVYRWHADNPVTFQKQLKHTIEHGHADDRADHYFSVCYWYQSEPATGFPALPPVAARIPKL